jgi:hypothetical protein
MKNKFQKKRQKKNSKWCLAERRGKIKKRWWTMRWWRTQDKDIIALFARKDKTIGFVLRRV